MTITSEQLQQIVPEMDYALAETVAAALNPAMDWAEVNTPARQAAFVAQWAQETHGFNHLVENLNYSAHGLLKNFRTHFTPEEAEDYARQPERIANRAYADRLGNGSEESGDGWRYRGGGYPQLTGKGHYLDAGRDLNLDLVNNPEMARGHQVGAYLAAWFWVTGGNNLANPKSPSCNEMADAGDFLALTHRINGGENGLAEREEYWERAKEVLGA
ncbi:MAG: glycoside hydrolase family 19 protein [Candidatus Cryosericum sp.]